MSRTPETDAALKYCTATMQPEDWCAYMAKTCQGLETQRDEARETIKGYESALESDSVVASCNCLTKTPYIKYHKPGCKYRLIVERDEARAREQNLLDTFQAIYDRLGIKEGDVPGGEKVSITVKRYVDEARAEAERLRKRVEELERGYPGIVLSDAEIDLTTGEIIETVIPVSSTQPEIFEAHGREWYKFTAGDAQPCAGNLKVCVLWPSDDEEIALVADLAQNFDWSRKPHRDYQVIGWRPADAPEKLPKLQNS